MKGKIITVVLLMMGMGLYAQESNPRERPGSTATSGQGQNMGNAQAPGDRAAMMGDNPAYQAKMDFIKGVNQIVHKEPSGNYPGKSFKLTYVKVTTEANKAVRTEKKVEFFDEAKKKITHVFADEELMPLTKALAQLEDVKAKYKPTADAEIFFNSKSGFKVGYLGMGGSWVEFVEDKVDGVTVQLKLTTGTISELGKAMSKKPEEDQK